MALKPGYKQTEIGVIPEDWEVHKIGDSMRLVNGRAFKFDDWKEQGIPIIRIQNLNNVDSAFNYYSGIIEDRHIVNVGNLLFAWSGTTGTSFGAHIWRGPTGVLNQHIFKVLPEKNRISLIYAFLVLQKVQQEIEKHAHGFKASFVHVKKSDLVNVLLPLPPTLLEQEAIAEALSDADALIESLETLVQKKRHIKQGAMQELLTGKKRLEGFSGDWEVKRLGDIAHIKTGSRNNQDKTNDGIYPFFVRSANVERIGSYSYDCEAILVPGEGGIGSIFHYINGKFDVHQRVYSVTQIGNGVSGRYLFSYMTNNFGKHAMEHSVKATVDSLRLPTFQIFEILMPPTLLEQTAIATLLSDMDAEIESLEGKLEKARWVKAGMMGELLTGRIRLV